VVVNDTATDDETGEPTGWRSRRLVVLGVVACLIAYLVAAAVVAVNAGWSLYTGRDAAQDGQAALSDGDAATARAAFADAAEDFDSAHTSLRGPFLRPGVIVPVVGRNVRTVTGLARAGALTAEAAELLASGIDDLPGGAASLAPRDGAIPLEPIETLAPALDRAAELLAEADRVAAATPATGLVGPVADARTELVSLLDSAATAARLTQRMAEVLPGFLGADEPRRYLFAASNTAELRGSAGFLGAHTILEVDEGQLTFGDFTATADLPPVPVSDIEPPNPDYADRLEERSSGQWTTANATADFPSAATALVRMWEELEDEQLDGVIAADPYALAALLGGGATVAVPGGDEIDADRLPSYVLNEAYAELTDPEERRLLLGRVAAGAVEGFLEGDDRDDPLDALRALGAAAVDGHLLLHTSERRAQEAFMELGVAGALPPAQAGALTVVTNQGAGNKIDYYADRSVFYELDLLEDGTAAGRATVEIHNDAPASGLPGYVIGPNAPGLEAGDSLFELSVYCGGLCELEAFRRDEPGSPLVEETELRHQVFSTWARLSSGERQRFQYDWDVGPVWDPDAEEVVYRLPLAHQTTVRPTYRVVELGLPPDARLGDVTRGAQWRDGRLRWEGEVVGPEVLEVRFAPAGSRGVVQRIRDFLDTPIVTLGGLLWAKSVVRSRSVIQP
jgi:hypothetical protein